MGADAERSTAARTVAHFPVLDHDDRERLFHRVPDVVDVTADKDVTAVALGATLYTPATRPRLVDAIAKAGAAGSVSMVIDLEDAVADHEVVAGLRNAAAALVEADTRPRTPMLFVRVRRPEQIDELLDLAGADVPALTGFVVPKFSAATGPAYLDRIVSAEVTVGRRLYAMPIIESARVLHLETRDRELAGIHRLLDRHRSRVLAVRIGAADLSGAFGIRRDPDLTIYDVHPVASAIAAIVNVLGRADGTGFLITGPVWEYYNSHERMFRPMLRHTPFEEIDAVRFRKRLVSRDLDGLLRELVLDRANGLQGKTVIHPSHVNVVHSTYAVSHEEYVDAAAIAGADDLGGVQASEYGNKMNEVRPHTNWARRTLVRARVFGVTRPDVGIIELLTAVVDR
ncbi:HpcH/HpaI aldolase/citrate lyase family protein [Williamsia sterculiae]|uniref:Citrate lyase beta subunit n=1 Tax=Williamsia sterculiae TaxID=1344003 RepID=A0A1N7EP26_9NOCA|nr:HpcH/HpaI aldolase/citrate lyase family protein [Williamsia sterculiae]SIR89830.1 Citrate lyase beta subunit [Williamsia sterculiae]